MNTPEPIHPGEHLQEIIEELGISQYRLAKTIGVPPIRYKRDHQTSQVDHCRYRVAYRTCSRNHA